MEFFMRSWYYSINGERFISDQPFNMKEFDMRKYEVVTQDTSLFSGNLSTKKLKDQLNTAAEKGWIFDKVISDTRRSLFLFKRETKFLVFYKEYA